MSIASKVLVCGCIIGACVTIRAQNQTISNLSGENRRLVTKYNNLVDDYNSVKAVAGEKRNGGYQPPREEKDVFETARRKRENLYR